MKLNRRIALLLACVMLLGALSACVDGDAQPSADPDGPTADPQSSDPYAELGYFTMTVAHAQPEGNPRSVSLAQFADDVDAATFGHVTVEVVGNGELGSEREMLEQVMAGTIQGMRGGHYDYCNRLMMFTLPFLTTDRAQVTALLRSDLAKRVCAEAGAATGTVILNLCDAGGYRQFSNDVRPITKPEDLAGLRMRTSSMETTTLVFETMGATTETIPYADLYLSLQTDLVDGQENPWVNIRDMEFYKVQKYFTEVNYQFHPDPFYVNAQWWNALPQELQTVLTDCAADMGEYNDRLIDENSQAAKEEIQDADAEIYVPTAQELEAFRQAVSPVYIQCVRDGICTAEELSEMQRIVASAD